MRKSAIVKKLAAHEVPRIAFKARHEGGDPSAYLGIGARPTTDRGTDAIWRGIQMLAQGQFNVANEEGWQFDHHAKYAIGSAQQIRSVVAQAPIIDVQAVADHAVTQMVDKADTKVYLDESSDFSHTVKPYVEEPPHFWSPPAEHFVLTWAIDTDHVAGMGTGGEQIDSKDIRPTAIYVHGEFEDARDLPEGEHHFLALSVWVYGPWLPGGLPFGPVSLMVAFLKDGIVINPQDEEYDDPLMHPWGLPPEDLVSLSVGFPSIVPMAEVVAVVMESLSLLGARNVSITPATNTSRPARRAQTKAGRPDGMHVIKVDAGKSNRSTGSANRGGERAWNGRRGGYAKYGVEGRGLLFGKYTCTVFRPFIPADEDADVMWSVRR